VDSFCRGEREIATCDVSFGFHSRGQSLAVLTFEKPDRIEAREKQMRKITTLIFSAAFVALVMAIPAWSQESTTSLIKQLREDTDRFSHSVDKALDKSSIDGSKLEDEINGYVQSFKDQIGTLQGDWEEKRDAKASAEELMVRGRMINNFLNKHTDRFKSPVHTEWNSVKLDIGRIAKANKLKVNWDQAD
jgi:hypothetical protein